jgi:hypothetical protein
LDEWDEELGDWRATAGLAVLFAGIQYARPLQIAASPRLALAAARR